MGINVGDQAVDSVYVGDAEVDRIYLGDEEVWSNGPPPPPFDEVIQSFGPSGFWPMTDASGEFVDVIGGNNASGVGVEYRQVEGPDGELYPAVGTGDYIEIPNAPYMEITETGLTIVMAFNPVSGNAIPFSKGFDVSYSEAEFYTFMSPSTGETVISLYTVDPSLQAVSGVQASSALAAGEAWNLMTVVFPGPLPTDVIRLYINSPDQADVTASEGTGTAFHTAANMILGTLASGGYPALGSAGPTAIYPVALSDADVAEIMESGVAHGWTPEPPPAPTAPTGLVATTVTDDEVLLGWDNAAGVYWDVEQKLSADPDGWVTAINSPVMSPFIDISYPPFEQGTSYDFRVRAVNSSGASDWATLTVTTRGITTDCVSCATPDPVVVQDWRDTAPGGWGWSPYGSASYGIDAGGAYVILAEGDTEGGGAFNRYAAPAWVTSSTLIFTLDQRGEDTLRLTEHPLGAFSVQVTSGGLELGVPGQDSLLYALGVDFSGTIAARWDSCGTVTYRVYDLGGTIVHEDGADFDATVGLTVNGLAVPLYAFSADPMESRVAKTGQWYCYLTDTQLADVIAAW